MFFTILFLLSSFTILFSTSSQAVNDFNITENIEYLFNLSGQATVTHQIDITNNFSQIYPEEYQIQIQGMPLNDLSATDEEGNILTDFYNKDDITYIKLKFNEAKVGKNQTTTFKLIYRISELAQNKGKTWEISLPQSVENSLGNSKITLKTPPEFGSLSFASIPAKFEDGLTQNTTTFQDSSYSKILVIFGNYQLFDFKINYYLENPSNNPVISEIALIPDTYSQSVYYQSISPPPIDINIDSDGNWLAKYQLNANQHLDITAIGQVKTGLHLPSENNNPEAYLQSQNFWPTEDPRIKEISQNLNTPRSIYDYVVSTLNYNYDRLNSSGRLGAIAAISDPDNSLCTEFTDLFVTLARAKGIPAREIQGYAYSNNHKIKPVNPQNDVLHAWPEYYNTSLKSWKAIDPTWGNTTNGIDYFNNLDLNHITFVIHGLSSQYPLPAGSYKKNDNEKSISIDFANQEFKNELSFPQISFQGKKLILQNNSPNSQKNLTLSSPELSFTHEILNILPYSSIQISSPPTSFIKSLSPKYKQVVFYLKDIDGQTSTQIIKYPLHFINLGLSIFISLIILIISGIIITSITHEKNS